MAAVVATTTNGAITATPVRDVDAIQIKSATEIDVFCQRGIGRFTLASTAPATVTIRMHYDDSKTFTKIEGVDAAGNALVTGPNTFTITLPGLGAATEVQVIDYYR